MTEHSPENTQLFLTAPMPCPYLPGKMERKLFTHLTGRRAPALHALLSDNGFRRSQNLIYRPACEGCAACQSVRVLAREFEFTGRYARILKRNEELNKESENREFDLASYHFNPKLRELSHDGKTQTLSPKENELLKMLAEHMNDLLPREQALKKIWGSDTYFNGRSMDVYIAKLRKYLRDDPKIEIVNIHGNGFRLVVQE